MSLDRRGFFGWLAGLVAGLGSRVEANPHVTRSVCAPTARNEIVGGVRRARPTMRAYGQCCKCGELVQEHGADHPFTHDWFEPLSHGCVFRYECPTDFQVAEVRRRFEALYHGPERIGPFVILPASARVFPIPGDLG